MDEKEEKSDFHILFEAYFNAHATTYPDAATYPKAAYTTFAIFTLKATSFQSGGGERKWRKTLQILNIEFSVFGDPAGVFQRTKNQRVKKTGAECMRRVTGASVLFNRKFCTCPCWYGPAV